MKASRFGARRAVGGSSRAEQSPPWFESSHWRYPVSGGTYELVILFDDGTFEECDAVLRALTGDESFVRWNADTAEGAGDRVVPSLLAMGHRDGSDENTRALLELAILGREVGADLAYDGRNARRSPHHGYLREGSVPDEFTVEVSQPLGGDTVRYRGKRETDPDEPPEPYAFRARVRPGGLFGIEWPIRLFLTIPVAPLSIRLPARSADLATSDTPPEISLVGPRAGFLFALEAWDYERREGAAGGFSFRVGTGMLLTGVDSPNVLAPSFLFGGSISLPFEGTSQAGSAVSVWFFWEHELLEGQSHFLMSLSLDLLSLGAGGTN